MAFPQQVRLVEVGPRDGLQNEPGAVISTAIKVELVERLADAGLRHIEAASFVSPKWVPQMADGAEVMARIDRRPGVIYSALTPNLKGLEAALAANVSEVAVFTAASDAFTQKNINCSIAESLERFAPLIERARDAGVPVRGYVSTVLGCPYAGEIAPVQVAGVCRDLYQLGCYEISLGDTIGVGTPLKAKRMLEAVAREVPVGNLAAHFHDTYGQALANLYAVVEEGIAVIDSSVSGLGGCPYAKGASGNVATEDVLYLLNGLGIDSGVDLDKLVATSCWISEQLGRTPASRVAQALGCS
ncbi:hydroxymethylglutaryl-CoA lyase [Marinobacterium zhoushanense]|uniref:Hydroxymethylglutaryl-CoA lyase n=1 Tax=Marinobacterium zhoushanense TaxID=1679163 RepID=A0ABQ1K8M7_9GAMM|nr:hydroxymethylglutaryl-CoA lyase [Marinobacterium zhoushanense]GGB91596.1 hydroxymethylglutaryl-CoA lyase [Marinobacterium zhoushanense]